MAKLTVKKVIFIIISLVASAVAISLSTKSDVISTFLSILSILKILALISFVVSVLDSRGYLNVLYFLSKPFVKFSRFREENANAFVVSFFSSNIAATMLADAYTEQKISRKEMIITGICNTIPPRFMFNVYLMPAVISTIGLTGIYYFLINSAIMFVMLLIFLFIARVIGKKNSSVENVNKKNKVLSWKSSIKRGFAHTLNILFRVMTVTVPFLLWTSYFIKKGYLNFSFNEQFSEFLNPASLAVIASRVGGFLAACGTASELLRHDQIAESDLLITLLLCNIFGGLVRFLRYSLPVSLSIYPKSDGLIIQMTSILSRNLLVVITIIVIYLLKI